METIKREGFMAFLLQNRQIIRFFILESYIGQHPTGFQLCYRLYVFKRLITLLLIWR